MWPRRSSGCSGRLRLKPTSPPHDDGHADQRNERADQVDQRGFPSHSHYQTSQPPLISAKPMMTNNRTLPNSPAHALLITPPLGRVGMSENEALAY